MLRNALLAGAALGLAIASKGTAYVICAPFMAWLLLRRLRAVGIRAATTHGALLAASALFVLAPQYARNLRVFHHPLSPREARADLGNLAHGAGALASNVVRNATVHLRSPVPTWNEGLTRAVVRLHALAGLDPEDPNTTYPGETSAVPLISTYKGRMGNPLHFLVFGAVAVVALLRPPELGRHGYGLVVLAGALLFCCIFRWQHWHGRLHTPLFLLAAPLVGTLLEPLATRWQAPAIALVWGASLPWLLANQMRPLLSPPETRFTYATPSIFAVPRERQYFGEDITAIYLCAVDDLARTGCANLGVIGGEETRLYPLFAFASAGLRGAGVLHGRPKRDPPGRGSPSTCVRPAGRGTAGGRMAAAGPRVRAAVEGGAVRTVRRPQGSVALLRRLIRERPRSPSVCRWFPTCRSPGSDRPSRP